MNKSLVQLNDKYGVVSDGELTVISKDSADIDFEDILVKENDLDYLHKLLKMTKYKLDETKKDSIAANIWSACILLGEVVVYLLLHKQLPLSVTIVGMVCFYAFSKGISIVEHGTRFTRHIKKKRLTERVDDTEEKILVLEKELKETKEKVKYNVNYKTNCIPRPLDHSKDYIHNLPEYTIEEEKEEPVVVKDLSLTRRKK